jgi:hypothetical protein
LRFYVLLPEVAGHFGSETIFIDQVARPPILARFHYEFEGWQGDPIVETMRCYIVTKALRDRILSLSPTGVAFLEAKVSKSEEFIERHPNRVLPDFTWLQVKGAGGLDDFGYTKESGHCIVVSERVLKIILEVGATFLEAVELCNWKGAKVATLEKIHRLKLRS